jgi:hypothetical protein
VLNVYLFMWSHMEVMVSVLPEMRLYLEIQSAESRDAVPSHNVIQNMYAQLHCFSRYDIRT